MVSENVKKSKANTMKGAADAEKIKADEKMMKDVRSAKAGTKK